jgi:hypothetical protein
MKCHCGVQLMSAESLGSCFTKRIPSGMWVVLSPFFDHLPNEEKSYGWFMQDNVTGLCEQFYGCVRISLR